MRSEPCGTAREDTDPPADLPQTCAQALFRWASSADDVIRRRMHRVPLTLRALLLVPLLAAAGDQARATLACGPRAESCLEAAGQSWLGAAGVALLIVYALVGALCIARLARAGSGPRSFLRLWVLATAGVGTVCGGQALLAGALGTGAALGGGWGLLLVLCVAAGGLIALALRAAPAAAALLRSLRPRAPRPRAAALLAFAASAPPALRPTALLSLTAAGRGPPLHLG
jgi:hypothetical protein